MKYHLSLTNRAAQDIQALASRILENAPTQGAEWLNGLEDAVASLDEFPERCGQAPESPARNGATIRQLLHGSKPNVYRVLFTVDDEKETVFRPRCSPRSTDDDRLVAAAGEQ